MASHIKRSRPEKGYFKTLEDGVLVKAERIKTKTEKVDTDTMYPIEVSTKFMRRSNFFKRCSCFVCLQVSVSK